MTGRASLAPAAAAAMFLLATVAERTPALPSLATNVPATRAAAPSAPATSARTPSATTTSARVAADPAAAEDIRDIRGPKSLSPAWLLPALAAALLLAAGGYAFWRWKHRRQRPPRALLPFEIALARLEEIRQLLDPARVREFSIAISDVVRQYIEAEFKVTATHRTTEEFLHDLLGSSQAALAAHRDLLAHFLEQCDMAKFAGVSLSRQIMQSLHQSARGFVIETSKPRTQTAARETSPETHIEEARDSLSST